MSRELDAEELAISSEIAEKILGWHKTISTTRVKRGDKPVEDIEIEVWSDADGNELRPVAMFLPMRFIESAWLVVEEMRRKGYWMRLYYGNDPCPSGICDVSFHMPNEGGRFVQDAPSRAISRAALKAVRDE